VRAGWLLAGLAVALNGGSGRPVGLNSGGGLLQASRMQPSTPGRTEW
jgi:hypothetical protein